MIVTPLLVGAAIGWLYCASLWLTIGLSARRTQPLVWFGVGTLLRLAVVGFAFFALTRFGPRIALAALVGFAAVRGGIIYWMRVPRHSLNAPL